MKEVMTLKERLSTIEPEYLEMKSAFDEIRELNSVYKTQVVDLSDRIAVKSEQVKTLEEESLLHDKRFTDMEAMLDKMHEMNTSLQMKLDFLERDRMESDASRLSITEKVEEK